MAQSALESYLQIPDEKSVDLVDAIGKKTQENKITWHKVGDSFIASAAGKLQLAFSLSEAVPFLSKTGQYGWSVFLIRGANSEEILKVNPTSITAASLLGGRNKLVEAVDGLFKIVGPRASGEIDKAIDLVNRL